MTDIDWEDVREDLGVARKIPAHPANVAPRPAISQSTAVEQSRAVAEVQAAIFIAQQFPRNEATALARVRAACGQRTIAEKAFYRYPRSDKTVTGETIHLARELVRCWGHVDFGIRELARDDQRGESEMLAYAWDLEVNTRVTNTFIAPHRRDRKEGARPLVDLREVSFSPSWNCMFPPIGMCLMVKTLPHLRKRNECHPALTRVALAVIEATHYVPEAALAWS